MPTKIFQQFEKLIDLSEQIPGRKLTWYGKKGKKTTKQLAGKIKVDQFSFHSINQTVWVLFLFKVVLISCNDMTANA